MKISKLFLSLFVIILTSCSSSIEETGSLEYFDLQDVRIIGGPFLNAQELDKKYLLDLDPDRLLAPFLKEAGLDPKAENYTNWENTGLDGHIGGHYVSALSMMWAATNSPEIGNRLDYMLSELKRCQDANGNGYLSGVPNGKKIWEEISKGEIRAGSFSLNEGWVPLYNIHKTFNGLLDAYVIAKRDMAKGMLVALTDWMIGIVANLTEDQIQDMLRSEHGGLNEVFAEVYSITGDEKYLILANQFSHQVLLEPLLNKEDKLTGLHANTQIPKVIGYERIGQLEEKSSWKSAAAFFWDEVVEKRSVSIGGNSAYEHFHPSDDFSRMMEGTQGPETCNTYNMLRLTKMLYQDSKDIKYMNYYEKALFNHILASQHPETGGLVYFTQMRPGHYRVYSQPQTSFWCCVGSGIENHAKYGEMIYAHSENALYVNLFIPSSVQWEDKKLGLIQRNNFPEEPSTELEILPETLIPLLIKIRMPTWANADELDVEMNGKTFQNFKIENGYIIIGNEWKKGDKIKVHFPMHLEANQLPDQSNYVSYEYGPIVLAAKTSDKNMKGLFADDSRGGHIAQGEIVSLDSLPMIVSQKEDLTTNVKKVLSDSLLFELSGLYPSSSNPMTLMPFYKLHESRYILYFPFTTNEGLEKHIKEMAIREQEAIKLAQSTVDFVSCGEQQPESDHGIQQQNTWTGYLYENHYREGAGWFSYKLKNNENKAKFLQIKIVDADKKRAAKLYLNGELIQELQYNGEGDEKIKEIVIEIPPNQLRSEMFEVKISSANDLWIMKIAEIRLLSISEEG